MFACSRPTTHSSTTVFTKLCTQIGTGPGKDWLNFESYLFPYPDVGLFDGFFNGAR